MEKLTERAAQILKNYKDAKGVNFTSDGTPFVQEAAAKQHAKTLTDKGIKFISKEEANAGAKPAEQPGGDATNGKPLSKMNKTELAGELAKREGLEVDKNATNKQLVEAIEKFDADKVAADKANDTAGAGAGTEGTGAAGGAAVPGTEEQK